jgi:hypothetical protein
MMIRVMYSDGRFDLVKASLLAQMLEGNRLASFKRADGWAVVGRDPIRGAGGGPYSGPERRNGHGAPYSDSSLQQSISGK